MNHKILFVYYQNINQNGISKAISQITRNLADHNLDITILFLMSQHEDFFPIESRIKKIYIDSFNTPQYIMASALHNRKYLRIASRRVVNYSYDLGSYFVMKNWIAENHNNFDQIISCWYKLSSYLTFTRAKNKVIAWEHNNYKSGGIIFYRLLRSRYSNLKGIICLTEKSVKHYKKINSNTVKIPNVIGDEYENADINFEAKEDNIFLASRLDAEKNIGEFLEIISTADIPTDWKINIAGDGNEYHQLKEKTTRLGLKNITFLGGISSKMMLDHFKKSKIFCLTSPVEGLLTTLIESMFCGNALISCDTPTGPSEIINSKNGQKQKYPKSGLTS